MNNFAKSNKLQFMTFSLNIKVLIFCHLRNKYFFVELSARTNLNYGSGYNDEYLFKKRLCRLQEHYTCIINKYFRNIANKIG